jgi:hypothetical protein
VTHPQDSNYHKRSPVCQERARTDESCLKNCNKEHAMTQAWVENVVFRAGVPTWHKLSSVVKEEEDGLLKDLHKRE